MVGLQSKFQRFLHRVELNSRRARAGGRLGSKDDRGQQQSRRQEAATGMQSSDPATRRAAAEKYFGRENSREREIANRIIQSENGKIELADVVGRNSNLNDADRRAEVKKMFPTLTDKQADAVVRAHNVGKDRDGAGVFNYTDKELAEKINIMKAAGIDGKNRKALLRLGYAGWLDDGPVRPGSDIIAEGNRLRQLMDRNDKKFASDIRNQQNQLTEKMDELYGPARGIQPRSTTPRADLTPAQQTRLQNEIESIQNKLEETNLKREQSRTNREQMLMAQVGRRAEYQLPKDPNERPSVGQAADVADGFRQLAIHQAIHKPTSVAVESYQNAARLIESSSDIDRSDVLSNVNDAELKKLTEIAAFAGRDTSPQLYQRVAVEWVNRQARNNSVRPNLPLAETFGNSPRSQAMTAAREMKLAEMKLEIANVIKDQKPKDPKAKADVEAATLALEQAKGKLESAIKKGGRDTQDLSALVRD